jgi:hypothetical protein
VIEHCIFTLKLNREDKLYKMYITDALMAIADNTTHLVGAQGVVDYGRTIKERWIDLSEPEKEDEKESVEDNRPVEEIASDIWERIRGN